MRIQNKKYPETWISVLAKRNKILTNKHGFVMITKGSHQGMNTIEPDALWKFYIIPKDVQLKD
jgi:hypothetical protein